MPWIFLVRRPRQKWGGEESTTAPSSFHPFFVPFEKVHPRHMHACQGGRVVPRDGDSVRARVVDAVEVVRVHQEGHHLEAVDVSCVSTRAGV